MTMWISAAQLIWQENQSGHSEYRLKVWGPEGPIRAAPRPDKTVLYGDKPEAMTEFKRITGLDVSKTDEVLLPPGRSASTVGSAVDLHGPGKIVDCPQGPASRFASGSCMITAHQPAPIDAVAPPNGFKAFDRSLFPHQGRYYAQVTYARENSTGEIVRPYQQYVPKFWASLLNQVGVWTPRPQFRDYDIVAESNVVTIEVTR